MNNQRMASGSSASAGRLATWGIASGALVIPLTTIVSHSFSRSTYPLLLPAIKDDLSLSNTQAGVGGTAIFVAYLAGVIAVTVLAGRFEPHIIMRSGLVTCAAGLTLITVAPGLPLLITGLSIANFGTAGIWITAPLLATRDVAPRRRGLVIGMLTGSMGLAGSLVALGTRGLRSATDNDDLWRPIYGVEAALAVVVLGLVLVTIAARTSAKIPGRGISLTSLRSMPGWIPVTVAYTAFGAVTSGYGSFLAEALESDGGISRSSVATIYLALGFGSLIGSPLVGWTSDRFGRRSAMTAVLLMSATAAGAVALLTGGALVVLVVVFGGMWAGYPALTATYVRDHLDDRAFGSAFGTMTIFYGLAAVAPPVLAGIVADARGSFELPYLGFAGLAIFGAIAISRTPA